MNYPIGSNASLSQQGKAYSYAQNAVQPVSETLQVDESFNSLGEVVDFHVETVRMLLRRLHPVTGDLCEATCNEASKQSIRVPLAQRIDYRRDEIVDLTNEVQNIIRALQI